MKEKEKRLINGSDLIFSRVEEEMKNVGRNGEIGLESKEWKRKKEEDELAVGGFIYHIVSPVCLQRHSRFGGCRSPRFLPDFHGFRSSRCRRIMIHDGDPSIT